MEQTLLLNASYEPLKVVRLAEGHHASVPGEGGGDRGPRPRDYAPSRSVSSCLLSFACSGSSRSAAVSTTSRSLAPTSTHGTPTPASTAGRCLAHRSHLRPRRAGGPGRTQGLGEHRHLLHRLQPPQGRPHPGRGRHAPAPPAAASGFGAGVRITIGIGLRNAPESWRDYLYWNVELDQSRKADSSGRHRHRQPRCGPLKARA